MEDLRKSEIKLESDTRLLALSDIHEHFVHFAKILQDVPIHSKMKLVICGDLLDKGGGYSEFLKIYRKLREIDNLGLLYMIKGNHELKHIRRFNQAGKPLPEELAWIDTYPMALTMTYPNGKRYTFVHGGVTPETTWDRNCN